MMDEDTYPLPDLIEELIDEGKLPPEPPPEWGFSTWQEWHTDCVKNPTPIDELPQIPDEALPADHPARLSGHTTYGELFKAMMAEQPIDNIPSSGTYTMGSENHSHD